MRQAITTDDAPKAAGGGYSQAIVANGFVYTAGQVAIDPATGQLTGTTIEEQTERVIENLRAVLAAAGCGLEDVVRAGAFLRDMADWAGFNETYVRLMPEPRPARTTVGVSLGDALVEIDMVAALPD
jgi:reactive intermediate/imine deaminase